MEWVLECDEPAPRRPVRTAVRIARRITRRKVTATATAVGTGVVMPRPAKWIRPDGPVCHWRLVGTPDAPLYGGALPTDFAGVPMLSGVYGGSVLLSPDLYGARDYAATVTAPSALLGGARFGGARADASATVAELIGLRDAATGQEGTLADGTQGGTAPGLPVPVSEPPSLILFASMLVLLAIFRRRRNGQR